MAKARRGGRRGGRRSGKDKHEQYMRGGPAREKTAYDALKFLLNCPARRVQVHSEVGFDPRHVEEQAIALASLRHAVG